MQNQPPPNPSPGRANQQQQTSSSYNPPVSPLYSTQSPSVTEEAQAILCLRIMTVLGVILVVLMLCGLATGSSNFTLVGVIGIGILVSAMIWTSVIAWRRGHRKMVSKLMWNPFNVLILIRYLFISQED